MDKDDDRRRGDGFLAAWSRRKRAALRAEAAAKKPEAETAEGAGGDRTIDAAPAANPPAVGEASVGEDAAEITQEELSALPSIADISGDTDLGPFLKRGVPRALRKAAMRKVWLGKLSILNHDDPAVDYAWDWNGPGGVPGASGTIGRDRVAKMIGDLINKDRRGQDPEAAADTPPADLASSEDGAAGTSERPGGEPEAVAPARPETEYPSDPRRLSDGKSSGRTQDPVETAGDAAEPKASAAPERPAGRARSHGGAIPT